MSVEGLWTTEIFGLWGWENRGVLVLKEGRALGGGRNHHSVGTYSAKDDKIDVSVEICYHGTPRTMFGSTERKFPLEIRGRREEEKFEGEMYRPDRPELRLPFRMVRRAGLS